MRSGGRTISYPNDPDTDRHLNPIPDSYTVTNGHRDPNTDAEPSIYADGFTLTHHHRDTVTFGHPDRVGDPDADTFSADYLTAYADAYRASAVRWLKWMSG